MSPRLREPFGTHGKVHEITAQPAGWRYVGFSLYRLREGERAAEATGVNEAILVMIERKAAIRAAGEDWGTLGERMDVLEKTPPHCLDVPNGAEWEAVAATDCCAAEVGSLGGNSADRSGRETPGGLHRVRGGHD